MILSDTGSALATLALALLFWSDHLALWHIYLLVGINSFCGGFQLPAAQAAITPPRRLPSHNWFPRHFMVEPAA